MDFQEFANKIRKVKGSKNRKVKNSFGVYDCYKWIRKNKWLNIERPLTEHEFYSIIRGVNKNLAQSIIQGDSIIFPYKMGKLELRKASRGVSLVNDKVINTYPVNWYETILLWYNDEEERKKKTLIRLENKDVFHVKYSKYNAQYENKVFYEFDLNRYIKRSLTNNIKEGKVDTLW